MRAVARALATGAVFLAALVLGLVVHVGIPSMQRAVVARVDAALAPVFAGKLTIDRVGSLGLGSVGGVDAHMDDPDGKTVIRATGIAGRVSTLALVRSLVSGEIVVDVPVASLTSAEVSLFRSLGYGSYRFVVRDISHLDPTVVFSIASWDGSGPYREMDIEISRWGEAAGKNAQYVLQPYYVPANVVRFLAPPGRLTYSFDWEPGRAAFRTVRGGGDEPGAPVVASHVFTSGVPLPGSETLHLNLYVFGDEKRVHLRQTVEVIVEKFEYLP